MAISWPNFDSGSNKAPEKPFPGTMSYQALYGLLTVTSKWLGLTHDNLDEQ